MPATISNFHQQLATVAPDYSDVVLFYDTSGTVTGKATLGSLMAPTNRVVDTTATQLTITAALHAGKTVTVSSAAPIAITLPAATGTGNRYKFVVEVAATATTSAIKCVGTDNMAGAVAVFDTSATDITAIAFAATATDDTIVLNGTTQSGVKGTVIELEDVASGHWSASMRGPATGSYATPFAATV